MELADGQIITSLEVQSSDAAYKFATGLIECTSLDCVQLQYITGGGGRSAVQLVGGTDVVTAGGGGGGADCQPSSFCGGGGDYLRIILFF